jgi:uncharacterized protein (DUF4415 family)
MACFPCFAGLCRPSGGGLREAPCATYLEKFRRGSRARQAGRARLPRRRATKAPWPEDPNPPDARARAEQAFKAATAKKAELPPQTPAVPGAKEQVTLRIDRDVLDYFQADGPGWQERINQALRKAAGK